MWLVVPRRHALGRGPQARRQVSRAMPRQLQTTCPCWARSAARRPTPRRLGAKARKSSHPRPLGQTPDRRRTTRPRAPTLAPMRQGPGSELRDRAVALDHEATWCPAPPARGFACCPSPAPPTGAVGCPTSRPPLSWPSRCFSSALGPGSSPGRASLPTIGPRTTTPRSTARSRCQASASRRFLSSHECPTPRNLEPGSLAPMGPTSPPGLARGLGRKSSRTKDLAKPGWAPWRTIRAKSTRLGSTACPIHWSLATLAGTRCIAPHRGGCLPSWLASRVRRSTRLEWRWKRRGLAHPLATRPEDLAPPKTICPRACPSSGPNRPGCRHASDQGCLPNPK